jgi:tellurite resistance protein
VIIFYRLLFHEPIEQPLRPTIVIMLAPPALAAIAYQVLAGGASYGAVAGFGTMLYGLALFVGLLLAVRIPMLMRMPFGLSAWSYSYPLAAFTIAATLYADRHPHWAAETIAIAGLAGTTLITLVLFVHTARDLIAGRLFRLPAPKAEAQD